MSRFEEELQEKRTAVETYLDGCFTGNPDYHVIYEAMRYSLLAGGKRIRPVLVLAFCEAAGGNSESILPAAASIEMVHTYSLIHDDLPCMDNDDYRRGRLTNHKVFGDDIALLAGDGLLTAAFETLSKTPCPPERVVEAVRLLALAAGEDGMVAGQVLDLLGENQHLEEAALRQVHHFKTGCMLAVSCRMGTLLGGGTEEQCQAAEEFGFALGMAFQIRDDMLDEIGSQEELGKPIGSDEANGKSTFVTLFGLEKCEELTRLETEKALLALKKADFQDTSFIEQLALSLVQRMK